MLLPAGLSSYSFTYDNYGSTPSSTLGTSVTPGATNAEGSWTQIAGSANITQDCYWLLLMVHSGATSTAAKNHLLDIGVDPAGGTSYTGVISNIVCGASGALAGASLAGHSFFFPIFIKSGSSVAVRIQGSNATAGTVRVCAKFYGQPSNPQNVPIGMFSETIGTITNSNGVSFTPANAADGTPVSLGTIVKPMWWWQLGYQIDNGTITLERTYIDLGFGPTGSQKWFKRLCHIGTSSEAIGDCLKTNLNFTECYFPLPAGTELWVRGRCENAADTGYNAGAIGIGG